MAKPHDKARHRKRPRNVRPDRAFALRRFAEDLLYWSATGDASRLSISAEEFARAGKLTTGPGAVPDSLSLADKDFVSRIWLRMASPAIRAHGGDDFLTVASIARCLIAIANGVDAREVFGQTATSGRQSNGEYHRHFSVPYWLARGDGKTPADAMVVATAQAAEWAARLEMPRLKPASIARIVRDERDRSITAIEQLGLDMSHVRAALAKRSKRGRE